MTEKIYPEKLRKLDKEGDIQDTTERDEARQVATEWVRYGQRMKAERDKAEYMARGYWNMFDGAFNYSIEARNSSTMWQKAANKWWDNWRAERKRNTELEKALKLARRYMACRCPDPDQCWGCGVSEALSETSCALNKEVE